uniref:Uncharacterized protein n=1 Tax=Spironucleus salmonicida TaxID=348837 RepID=V6LRK1_9EUKA|eukprot:EST43414.1 Hypothetical protein SS50377_16875 [Spironucleus salmonicida]
MHDEELHRDYKIVFIRQGMSKNIYTYEEELQQTQRTQANASLAGTTTAVARTMLNTLIRYVNDELKGVVLYADTDQVYCVLDRSKFLNLTSVTFKNTYSCKCEQKLGPNEWVCIGAKPYAYTDRVRYAYTSNGITLDKTGIIEADEGKLAHVFDIYKSILFDQVQFNEDDSIQMKDSNAETKVKQELNFIRNNKIYNIYTHTRYKVIRQQQQKRLLTLVQDLIKYQHCLLDMIKYMRDSCNPFWIPIHFSESLQSFIFCINKTAWKAKLPGRLQRSWSTISNQTKLNF